MRVQQIRDTEYFAMVQKGYLLLEVLKFLHTPGDMQKIYGYLQMEDVVNETIILTPPVNLDEAYAIKFVLLTPMNPLTIISNNLESIVKLAKPHILRSRESRESKEEISSCQQEMVSDGFPKRH